jgi:hypothetical protein
MARLKYSKKSDKPIEKRRKSNIYIVKWKMWILYSLLGLETAILIGVLAKWLLN